MIVTLDNHLAGAVDRARRLLASEIPGLDLAFHAAAEWNDPAALQHCLDSIGRADIIVATMLFMEDHAQAVLDAIRARRDQCDAVLGCMSAPEIVKLTRVGRFNMDGSKRTALDFLKRLRGGGKPSDTGGAGQLAMLRRIPRILRYIPGPAQDVRAYFLTLQYWLAGSDENIANLVRFLTNRYAGGANAGLRGKVSAALPIEYPEVALYHPHATERLSASVDRLPRPPGGSRGTVGLLLMRSYVLANNTAHYDAVIAALEARGLRTIPAFASGLDSRPAVEAFFKRNGAPSIDALVSLTGFSLVGGPAYNDSKAAAEMLAGLDVPYVAAHALEFQTIEQWEGSDRGLSPVEATMMVAIPELDGATAPSVFGGRSSTAPASAARDIRPHPERIARLADRVERLVRLRTTDRAKRKVAIVLFNFPPNGGATGTAAFLGVYESLHRMLKAMQVGWLCCRSALTLSTNSGTESSTAIPDASASMPTSSLASRSTIISAASLILGKSKPNGARRQAGIRPTADRCLCLASGSETCSSQSNRRWATRATLCACCSSAGSLPLTRSRPSTVTCARISMRTSSCISACTARSSSCPASKRGSALRVGPTA